MHGKHSILNSRYFYLLISLSAYFLLSPLFITHVLSYLILSILFSFVIIFSANTVKHSKLVMIITLTLGAVTFLGTWYTNFVTSDNSLRIAHFITTIMFLSTITYSVIYSITRHQTISADTLLGAICGYVLIGATWSFIYLIISDLDPMALTDNFLTLNVTRRAQDAIYFSFATLTTTGYGDILPRSSLARTWSWMEAVTGQIYLTVWVARLVGLQVSQKFSEKGNLKK